MTPTNKLAATLYDRVIPLGRPVSLSLDSGRAILEVEGVQTEFSVSELFVSPRVEGGAHRFVDLPNGSQLLCNDDPRLASMPQEKTEGLVAWLERRTWAALAAVIGTGLGVYGAYVYGVPAIADTVAMSLTMEQERAISRRSVDWLRELEVFSESELDAESRNEVLNGFRRLTRGTAYEKHYRLDFMSMTDTGPNAFALPGATIIVADEMMELCTVDETLAILAHEIGHVERRHVMRQVLRSSATFALASLVAADVSTLTLSGMSLPVAVSEANYSREFEAEADEFAFSLLIREKKSPALFGKCLARLAAAYPADDSSSAFVASHPPSAERTARAEAAAVKAGLPLPRESLEADQRGDDDSGSEPEGSESPENE